VMTVWAWILIAAIVVVAIPAVIVTVGIVRNRRKTQRLKQHYGREYERLLSENGSEKAANRELTTRERKRSKLDIVPLTPAALSNFTARWQEVQASFVDNPASAVCVADRLITEVMRERGYPVDDFDRRAADISVDHPEIVDNYRAAHGINTSKQDDVSTEQQRDAFVHYRALFEKLLETAKDDDAAGKSQEASA
jgi:type II secretory pathway pseudopilin PulG